MADQRVVGIGLPLTPQQCEAIRNATGIEPTEVVFVTATSKPDTLQNELTSPADVELAKTVWETNKQFASQVQQSAESMQGWAHPPALSFVR